MNNKIPLFFLIIYILFQSCSYPEVVRDELVYENTFEERNIDQIDGAIFSEYNNSTVIGNYNNNGFTLHLENIGRHDYIFISFGFITSLSSGEP